jgi:hypothetical protein
LRITFAAHLWCGFVYRVSAAISVAGATIKPVRHYTIKRIAGGMQFTCVRCKHSVTTAEFDARNGNLRTQAAGALNQHAAQVHHEPVMVSSLDVQQRIWRA